MGTGSSKSESTSSLLESLNVLTSTTSLPFDDPRWQALFRCVNFEELQLGAPLSANLSKHGARFIANNLSTANFQRLILHCCSSLLRCVDEVRSALANPSSQTPDTLRESCSSCVNVILLCKIFLQYFLENLKQDIFAVHCSGWPDQLEASIFGLPEIGKGVPRALMRSLVTFLLSVKVSDDTYEVYEEALSLLLVLFSVQMFNSKPDEPSFFLDMLIDEGEYFGASAIVERLLQNVASQRKRAPKKGEKIKSGDNDADDSKEEAGIFLSLARYGSSVLFFPVRAIEWLLRSNAQDGSAVIANYSALVLLFVANTRRPSLFLDAFTMMRDPQQAPQGADGKVGFEFPFNTLFDTFCVSLGNDAHVLLFYFLLHGNPFFSQFIQSKADLDTLLVPLLNHLYDVTGGKSIDAQQVYIMLIILLIMSQQEEFGHVCSRLRIAEVPFYKEQTLLDVSLADLIVVVLVRTVVLNLSRLQDGYLHTNCLAILANLSGSLTHLHSYSAMRLFGLLFFLFKRWNQVSGLVGASTEDPVLHIVVDTKSGGESQSPPEEDATALVALYERLISILAEVLQGIAGLPLTRNQCFVYALLHTREQFSIMSEHPRWKPSLEVLVRLTVHFEPMISEESRTIDQVMTSIERGIISWAGSGQATGVLKFTYTEEANASLSFFTPYVLSLVYRHGGTVFNPSRITLFYVPEMDALVDEDPLAGQGSGLVSEA